jgi:hypothetical protein
MEQPRFRTRSVGTKVTSDEFESLTGRARKGGQTLSEWTRDVLLRESRSDDKNFDLICEIVGLQLLLMNVLAPLARGEKISAEQFQAIVKSVQSTKLKAAEEMLSRRRQGNEV